MLCMNLAHADSRSAEFSIIHPLTLLVFSFALKMREFAAPAGMQPGRRSRHFTIGVGRQRNQLMWAVQPGVLKLQSEHPIICVLLWVEKSASA